MRIHQWALLATIAGGAACYHATVETGLTPSAVTVEKGWASSWIYGLVPPSAVSTAAKCSTGIARVETQLPFVNMLVGFLTAGIYTPMAIKVTCAQRGSASVDGRPVEIIVIKDETPAARDQAFAEALRLSSKLRSAVLVQEFVP